METGGRDGMHVAGRELPRNMRPDVAQLDTRGRVILQLAGNFTGMTANALL
jgi:hypothetical protein